MSNARRNGTLRNYNATWEKWGMWCSERNTDPFKCDSTYVLDFLTTFGVYRLAISAYHSPVDGVNVEEHPLVPKLLKGIGNLRPPKPKYEMIRDIEQVLNYLRLLPENKNPNLKLITCKYVVNPGGNQESTRTKIE